MRPSNRSEENWMPRLVAATVFLAMFLSATISASQEPILRDGGPIEWTYEGKEISENLLVSKEDAFSFSVKKPTTGCKEAKYEITYPGNACSYDVTLRHDLLKVVYAGNTPIIPAFPDNGGIDFSIDRNNLTLGRAPGSACPPVLKKSEISTDKYLLPLKLSGPSSIGDDSCILTMTFPEDIIREPPPPTEPPVTNAPQVSGGGSAGSPSPSQSEDGDSSLIILGIILAAVILVAVLGAVIYFVCLSDKDEMPGDESEGEGEGGSGSGSERKEEDENGDGKANPAGDYEDDDDDELNVEEAEKRARIAELRLADAKLAQAEQESQIKLPRVPSGQHPELSEGWEVPQLLLEEGRSSDFGQDEGDDDEDLTVNPDDLDNN